VLQGEGRLRRLSFAAARAAAAGMVAAGKVAAAAGGKKGKSRKKKREETAANSAKGTFAHLNVGDKKVTPPQGEKEKTAAKGFDGKFGRFKNHGKKSTKSRSNSPEDSARYNFSAATKEGKESTAKRSIHTLFRGSSSTGSNSPEDSASSTSCSQSQAISEPEPTFFKKLKEYVRHLTYGIAGVVLYSAVMPVIWILNTAISLLDSFIMRSLLAISRCAFTIYDIFNNGYGQSANFEQSESPTFWERTRENYPMFKDVEYLFSVIAGSINEEQINKDRTAEGTGIITQLLNFFGAELTYATEKTDWVIFFLFILFSSSYGFFLNEGLNFILMLVSVPKTLGLTTSLALLASITFIFSIKKSFWDADIEFYADPWNMVKNEIVCVALGRVRFTVCQQDAYGGVALFLPFYRYLDKNKKQKIGNFGLFRRGFLFLLNALGFSTIQLRKIPLWRLKKIEPRSVDIKQSEGTPSVRTYSLKSTLTDANPLGKVRQLFDVTSLKEDIAPDAQTAHVASDMDFRGMSDQVPCGLFGVRLRMPKSLFVPLHQDHASFWTQVVQTQPGELWINESGKVWVSHHFDLDYMHAAYQEFNSWRRFVASSRVNQSTPHFSGQLSQLRQHMITFYQKLDSELNVVTTLPEKHKLPKRLFWDSRMRMLLYYMDLSRVLNRMGLHLNQQGLVCNSLNQIVESVNYVHRNRQIKQDTASYIEDFHQELIQAFSYAPDGVAFEVELKEESGVVHSGMLASIPRGGRKVYCDHFSRKFIECFNKIRELNNSPNPTVLFEPLIYFSENEIKNQVDHQSVLLDEAFCLRLSVFIRAVLWDQDFKGSVSTTQPKTHEVTGGRLDGQNVNGDDRSEENLFYLINPILLTEIDKRRWSPLRRYQLVYDAWKAKVGKYKADPGIKTTLIPEQIVRNAAQVLHDFKFMDAQLTVLEDYGYYCSLRSFLFTQTVESWLYLMTEDLGSCIEFLIPCSDKLIDVLNAAHYGWLFKSLLNRPEDFIKHDDYSMAQMQEAGEKNSLFSLRSDLSMRQAYAKPLWQSIFDASDRHEIDVLFDQFGCRLPTVMEFSKFYFEYNQEAAESNFGVMFSDDGGRNVQCEIFRLWENLSGNLAQKREEIQTLLIKFTEFSATSKQPLAWASKEDEGSLKDRLTLALSHVDCANSVFDGKSVWQLVLPLLMHIEIIYHIDKKESAFFKLCKAFLLMINPLTGNAWYQDVIEVLEANPQGIEYLYSSVNSSGNEMAFFTQGRLFEEFLTQAVNDPPNRERYTTLRDQQIQRVVEKVAAAKAREAAAKARVVAAKVLSAAMKAADEVATAAMKAAEDAMESEKTSLNEMIERPFDLSAFRHWITRLEQRIRSLNSLKVFKMESCKDLLEFTMLRTFLFTRASFGTDSSECSFPQTDDLLATILLTELPEVTDSNQSLSSLAKKRWIDQIVHYMKENSEYVTSRYEELFPRSGELNEPIPSFIFKKMKEKDPDLTADLTKMEEELNKSYLGSLDWRERAEEFYSD
jgi:hypothetical protein